MKATAVKEEKSGGGERGGVKGVKLGSDGGGLEGGEGGALERN